MVEFKIGPKRMALIVHDMEKIFVEGPYTPRDTSAQVLVEKIKKLTDICRSKGIPVIYTKACYRRDGADMGLIPEFFEELKRREILIDDQEGTQIVDELAPQEEDFLIKKVGSYSAFYNTALESILRNLGIDTIVITGGGSNVGCDSTARDAHSRGIKVIFIEDATSAVDLPDMGWGAVPHDVAHKVVCTTVAFCIGQVMKSEDLIKKLG